MAKSSIRRGNFVPEALRKHLVQKMLWKFPLPLALKKKITDTIVYLSPKLQEIFFDNFHGVFTREMQQHLFDSGPYRGLSSVDPYANANALFERSNTQNFLHQMLLYRCKYGFSRTPDEAGSNEHGRVYRESGAISRSFVGRVCRDYSTPFALARTSGKAAGQKSHRKIPTSQHRASTKNGISSSFRQLAQRRFGGNGQRDLVR